MTLAAAAPARRLRVLMPVFNEIDFDGRVERCAVAVGRDHDVTVLALDSGAAYQPPGQPPGFTVERLRLPGLGRLRVLRVFLFWLALFAAAVRHRPDLIHAHDYFLAFPGWLAARLLGARVIYDAHELIIPTPGRAMRLSERVWLGLERAVVGRVDRVIAASADRARLMRDHYRLAEVPTVIRNIPVPPADAGAETGIDPVPGHYPALCERPAGRFRLIYQGYMPPQFRLDRFVAALAALGDGYQLVLAGLGPALPALERQIADTCPPGRVLVLGRVPRRHLPAILRYCDAGIIVYGTELLNELHCAPNKVHEYAQAGLPMVANDHPGLRALIEPPGIGVCGADPAAAIRQLEAGRAGYRDAAVRFGIEQSWANEAPALHRLYAGLAGVRR